MSVPKTLSADQTESTPKIFKNVLIDVPEKLPETSELHTKIDSFINGSVHRGLYVEGKLMFNCIFNGFSKADLAQQRTANITIENFQKTEDGIKLTSITFQKTESPELPEHLLKISDLSHPNPAIIIGDKALCLTKV